MGTDAYAVCSGSGGKEVAQYSYILEKTGILESLDNLNTKTESFESDMNSIRENLETIQSAGEKAVQGQDVGNQIAGIKNAAGNTYNTVKEYVENPDEFINGVLLAFKRDTINGISSLCGKYSCEILCGAAAFHSRRKQGSGNL